MMKYMFLIAGNARKTQKSDFLFQTDFRVFCVFRGS